MSHERRVFELHRARQQVDARSVLRERPLEQREVEPRDVLRDVGQRVLGDRVEVDVGVAQASGRGRAPRPSCWGSSASSHPRLTARLVEPTPPVEPLTVITRQAPPAARSPKRVRAITLQGVGQVVRRTGWVRNSFAPARMVRRIRLPSVELLATSRAVSGLALDSSSTRAIASSGSLVQRDERRRPGSSARARP